MTKKRILIVLVLIIISSISAIYLVIRPKLYFKGIGIIEQIEITKDLLQDENARAQMTQGLGIEVALTTSNYCGANINETCQYISCKMFTSRFGDYVPCSIEKDSSGKYVIHNSL